MVERIVPCKECRKRRRKCIRNSIYDICSRCTRLDRECINSDEEPNYTGYDQDLPQLQKQVEELTNILYQMENEAKQLLRYNQNKDSNNNNNNNQMVTNHSTIIHNSKPWSITFHSGMLHIETGIRSISDLLMQFVPIQYLSPFQLSSKSEEDLIIQFDKGKTVRFMPLTISLLVKCIKPELNSFLLPMINTSSLGVNINSIIDELINMYFHCRNTHRALIHERTFMQHYRNLKSPSDSLMCLSICCYVTAMPCSHTAHDLSRFRQLGDLFYNLAKTKLMLQFDEVEKRLENLIVINLLSDYMHITLKLDDFKNLISLGYRICVDLEPWFESTKDQGNTVERTLYSRHFARIVCNHSLLSLITNEPIQYLSTVLPEWLVMYDDPPEIEEAAGRQNYLMALYNLPCMTGIKLQIHNQFKGNPVTLTFETIIQLDEVLNRWWRECPSKYQVCVDWLDLEKCKAAIDKCDNTTNLIFFNQFLAFMVDIYSTLLQPKALDSTDNQILSVVQELTLRRCLHCSEVLIYSQRRVTVLNHLPNCLSVITFNEYIFHTLDALIIMSLSSNLTVRTKSQQILSKTQFMIESLPFMQYHIVDPFRSPLMASIRSNDLDSLDLSEYYRYPQPWFAMIYDLSHYLDKAQIIKDIPSPPVSITS